MHRISPIALGFAALALPITALASGQHKVLVLAADSEEPPQGFVQELTIQLAGSMSVERGGEVRGALRERLEAVVRPLEQHHASVGVWVERAGPAGSEPEFLVYVVSSRRGRVLVEIVRLPGPESPETERALALKVREVLETVVQPGREPDVAAPIRPPVAAARKGTTAERAHARWSATFEGGVTGASAASSKDDPEVGAAFAAGARFADGTLLAEAVLGAGWSSGTHTERGRARTDTNGWEASLSWRALHASDALAVGLDLAVGARVVRADGVAPDGKSGKATKVVPSLRAGPEVRVALSRSVSLRAAGGLEYALIRQTFSVGGVVTTDLGHARGTGWVGFVAALP
jgi:hypothetical protein